MREGVRAGSARGLRTPVEVPLAAALGVIARRRWVVLLLVHLLATSFSDPAGPPPDLHYLVDGARWLGSDGVHLYARHPEIQIGPVSLALVGLVTALGLPVMLALEVTGVGILLVTAALLERLAHAHLGTASLPAPEQARVRARVALASLALAPALALASADVVLRWGHLDDTLALALLLAAALAARVSRPVLAGGALGLALACKPWVLVGVVVLLGLGSHRSRAVALTWMSTLTALAYLPFLLGDLTTLSRLAEFSITAQSDSLPALLGRDSALRLTRPIQLGAALVLGLAALRWRPESLLALVVLARLVFDAGTFEYYTAALVVGVGVVDLVRAPRARTGLLATRAWVAWLLLNWNPYLLPLPPGVSRLLVLLALAVSVLWVTPRQTGEDGVSASSSSVAARGRRRLTRGLRPGAGEHPGAHPGEGSGEATSTPGPPE